ncbi:MAG: hypothetical protein ACKVHE_21855 [Planctomycetales bacterium]
MSLVSKDEPLTTSMIHIGYIVLKEFEASSENRLSLTAITSLLKKKKITQYRPIMFALIFLHVAGVIEFRAPYIYRID